MTLGFPVAQLAFLLVLLFGCNREENSYKILGNIEDPQNEIANTIAALLVHNLNEDVRVVPGIGSLSNLDSLEMGLADFAIVDNYSRFSDQVFAVMPLYPQALHILHKRDKSPAGLRELFELGKIYAGLEGSGTKRFVHQLIDDLGLNEREIEFVDVFRLFEADVIFAFTDLLSQAELRDLKDYVLFSLDDIDHLGKGSIAEGICARYPQFETYVFPKDVYGDFTEEAMLTVKVEAVLVCRKSLSREFVFAVTKTLFEQSQVLQNINPFLFHISSDFDPRKLNFMLHPGSRDYLERHEPSFLEKYAEVASVIITIFLAMASGIYTVSQWQKAKKKNKIDVYYSKLIQLRGQILRAESKEEIKSLEQSLKRVQEEAINLVITEKLMADGSFSIFLDLSRIVMDEIGKKINRKTKKERYDSGGG